VTYLPITIQEKCVAEAAKREEREQFIAIVLSHRKYAEHALRSGADPQTYNIYKRACDDILAALTADAPRSA
jgi:hypothetical protein